MREAGLISAVTSGYYIQILILTDSKMKLDFCAVKYSILLQDAGDMTIMMAVIGKV